MPVSPAREAAYQILHRVESGRAFAVDLLQSPRVTGLREADRRLLTELVMGVLRWRGELDFQIEELSGKPLRYFDLPIAIILRLGIYQIRFLERIPKFAVVNEAVNLTKAAHQQSAASLVNALLRKCDPPRSRASLRGNQTRLPESSKPQATEAAVRTLPGWLRERWTQNFGVEATRSLARASVTTPPTTLTVTTEDREEARRELACEGIRSRSTNYASQGLVVESGNPQTSRLWLEGRLLIQDEASQLVEMLVAPRPGQRVLDLCAAPGTKSAQMAVALGRGTLVACDRSFRRLQVLKELLARHVPRDVRWHVVQQDAARALALGVKFDRILLDAPCSGTGTLSRNPEIKLRLRAADLGRFAEKQARMLENALDLLAPAGRLVYATCSLEPEEDEFVVESVLEGRQALPTVSAARLASEFPVLSDLFDQRGYLRTRPDLHAMDGFFAAVIEDKSEIRN